MPVGAFGGRQGDEVLRLAPFELRLTAETIIEAPNADGQDAIETGDRRNHQTEDSSS